MFSFALENSITPRDGVPYVVVDGLGTNIPSFNVSLGTGNAAPMMVAGWAVKRIGQLLPASNALNTISVTIASQARLMDDVIGELVVRGLFGSTTPAGTLSVETTGPFASIARWNPTNGTLAFKLSGSMAPYTEYVLEVVLQNPIAGRDANSGITVEAINAQGVEMFEPILMEAAGGNNAPFMVADFLQKTISQSTMAALAENTLTITMATRSSLEGFYKTSIIISGLTGSGTVGANVKIPLDPADTPFGPYCRWYHETGTIILKVINEEGTVAGETYVLSFGLRNGPKMQMARDVTIRADYQNYRDILYNGPWISQTLMTNDVNLRAPLLIAGFDIIEMEQSSATVGTINQISLNISTSLDVNVTLFPSFFFVVQGLVGAQTASGNIVVSMVDRTSGDSRSLTGTWNRTLADLTIPLPDSFLLEESTVYEMRFTIQNAYVGQESPNIMVKAVGEGFDISPSPVRKAEGDSAPLKIAGLVQRSIAQSTASIGAINTITVTVSSSGSMLPGTEIRIDGLTGTMTPSGNIQISCMQHPATFRGMGRWNMTSGTVGIWVQKSTVPYQPFVLQFNLTNPLTGQQSPSVGIAAYMLDVASVPDVPDGCTCPNLTTTTTMVQNVSDDVIWIDDEDDDKEDWNYQGVGGDQFVYDRQFSYQNASSFFSYVEIDPDLTPSGIIMRWEISSSWYGAYWGSYAWPDDVGENVAMGSLPPVGQWIRLEVTLGSLALSPAGQVSGLQFGAYDGRATWDAAGFMGVPVERNVTQMTTIQPPCCSLTKSIILGDQMVLRRELMQKASANGAPLLVAAFSTMRIAQSTVSASSINVITVTMATYSALTLQQSSRVSISGLRGSSTPTGALTLTSPNGTMFNAIFGTQGQWYQPNGTLVVTVLSDSVAADTYIFSFRIMNPSDGQNSTAIDIVSTGTQSSVTSMDKAEGNLAPMLVADFIVRSCGQSDASQGAMNTITITLRTRASLLPGTWVTISGLTGSVVPDSTSIAVTTIKSPSPSASHFRGQGSWTRMDGLMRLYVQEPTQPREDYVLSFSLRNPYVGQASPEPMSISSGGAVAIDARPLSKSSDNAAPLLVAGFSKTLVHQKEEDSVAYAVNHTQGLSPVRPITITFTFSTTSSLLTGSRVKLDNMLGSPSKSTADLPVTCATQGAYISANGQWVRETGTLSLRIIQDTIANVEYTCMVSLHGPLRAQAPPALTISVNGTYISPTVPTTLGRTRKPLSLDVWCAPFVAPAHGAVFPRGTVMSPNDVLVTCDDGYILRQGSVNKLSGRATCMSDGRWSSIDFVCHNIRGSLLAWGRNEKGQLGDATSTNRLSPTLVRLDGIAGDVSMIAAGAGHSLAITGNGSLYTWGSNEFGQLGRATTGSFHSTPRKVDSFGAIRLKMASAGEKFSVVLGVDGSVWCWGQLLGNVGNGGAVLEPTLSGLPAGTIASHIAAGASHVLVLAAGGKEIYAWGSNSQGQLALEKSISSSNTPRLIVKQLDRAVSVAAGEYHSLVLLDRSVPMCSYLSSAPGACSSALAIVVQLSLMF